MPRRTDHHVSEYEALVAEHRRRRLRALLPSKAALWALPNVAFVGVAALALFGPALPIVSVSMTVLGLAALLAPVAAVVFDGRAVVAAWLVGSAWGSLLLRLWLSTQSSGWRQDDGLGQGFQIWFTFAAGAVYLAAVVVLFGLRVLLRRDGRHGAREPRDAA